MVFCACDTATKDCTKNPNDYSYLAYSDDGASWQLVSGFSGFQGSVPDVVKRGSTLYIYTPDPDKVTRYNITTGVMDSKIIAITQTDGSADDLGDVSPYLDPSTNKIVLFYKTTAGFQGDPQTCTTCAERSATEVDGSDGAQFLTDSGDRFQPARSRSSAMRIFSMMERSTFCTLGRMQVRRAKNQKRTCIPLPR